MNKIIEFNPELTKRQSVAWAAIHNPEKVDVLYGGAKGGGKSHFLCVWVFCEAMAIAAKYKLPRTDNPPHVGWFGRKQATDFAGTTLQTWRTIIPQELYKLRGGTERDVKHIVINGRVAVDYGGLDKQENINKFNSAEYMFIGVDQAEEVNRDEVSVLRASRRMKLDEREHNYKGLFTANPAQCWLKDEFLEGEVDSRQFVQALPSDNPYLPLSYVDTLKDSFAHRPDLLDAYLHGSWEAFEGDDQIILEKWISGAQIKTGNEWNGLVVSCDPARFGDDETVIYVMDGGNITHQRTMGKSRTTEISSKIAELSRMNSGCPAIVDEIGIGAGVVDELVKLGVSVIGFNSSAKSSDPDVYYNLRAEAWSLAGRLMSEGRLATNGSIDLKLKNQLLMPRYSYRNGKTLVEPKESIKKRLGSSPDRADTYVMGLWAIENNKGKTSSVTSSQIHQWTQQYSRVG